MITTTTVRLFQHVYHRGKSVSPGVYRAYIYDRGRNPFAYILREGEADHVEWVLIGGEKRLSDNGTELVWRELSALERLAMACDEDNKAVS